MAITDLTNTTWEIPSGWTATAGYGQFKVDVSVNDTVPMNGTLPIGYTFGDMGEFDPIANRISFWDTNGSGASFLSETALTIVITGGTDATNANLISWLEANGELQKPEPTVTFDLTTLDLPEGTHTISVIGKADGYKASAASEGVEFVVEPQSVTLAKGTYVAKDTITLNSNPLSQNMNFTADGFDYSFMESGTMKNNGAIDLVLSYGITVVYSTNEGGWYYPGDKTVTLATDQTVSAEFGTWFNSNFTKQPDTVTIEAGTYVANDNFNSLADAVRYEGQPLNFSSNGVNYSSIGGRGYADFWYDNTMVYYQTSDDGDTFYWTWTNTNYKTITISTPQSVSPEFGEWFNANFSPKTYTLTVKKSGYPYDYWCYADPDTVPTTYNELEKNEIPLNNTTSTFSIPNIKNFVYIGYTWDFRNAYSSFTNCTYERMSQVSGAAWNMLKITITGDNPSCIIDTYD